MSGDSGVMKFALFTDKELSGLSASIKAWQPEDEAGLEMRHALANSLHNEIFKRSRAVVDGTQLMVRCSRQYHWRKYQLGYIVFTCELPANHLGPHSFSLPSSSNQEKYL